ncbi:hypothetical protein JL720_8681 [Aureococcus anophagefferens]|nr:hypothetical protein JL720_8681 [Aureococcus anophagefferens]
MHCADCRAPKPNWASCSLGTFICFNCSGLHRGLGTHLSFVRSVTLDEWTQKQANVMQLWGNAQRTSFFEARMPPDFKPDQRMPGLPQQPQPAYQMAGNFQQPMAGGAFQQQPMGGGFPPQQHAYQAAAFRRGSSRCPAASRSRRPCPGLRPAVAHARRLRPAVADAGRVPPQQQQAQMRAAGQPQQAQMPGGFGQQQQAQMPGGFGQQQQPMGAVGGAMGGGAMGGSLGYPPAQQPPQQQRFAGFPPQQAMGFPPFR